MQITETTTTDDVNTFTGFYQPVPMLLKSETRWVYATSPYAVLAAGALGGYLQLRTPETGDQAVASMNVSMADLSNYTPVPE